MTASPIAGWMPVSAVMFTWWVTITSVSGPRWAAMRLRSSAVCNRPASLPRLARRGSKNESAAGQCVARPKASFAVSMQRHHRLASTSPTGTPAARNASPRRRA